ncbi:MAG: glycosyl transferase [Spirochaetia bacterium]|nr:glycosyl transferase [Spirochaetia bacterium]
MPGLRFPAVDRRISDIRAVLILLILSLVLLFPALGSRATLRQGDEEMHVATVRESLIAKSYAFPQFDGGMNIYKPPGLFWAAMGSDLLFGVSLASERFPSLLFFTGSALAIFFGLRLFRAPVPYALLVAAGSLTTLGAFKFSRLVMMEAALAFALTAQAVLLLAYFQTHKSYWLVLGAMISGAAFLLKGPLFQVYSVAMLGTMSLARVMTVGRPGWTGRRRIKGEILNNVIFHASSAVVPVVWLGALVLFSDRWQAFVRFFVFTENLGKFSANTVNQPEWILPVGWLLYSMPLTIPLTAAFLTILFRPARGRAAWAGRVLAFAVVVIALIHITPNRKDYYYAVPLIPVGILAVGLGLMRGVPPWLQRILAWNRILLAAVGILCAGLVGYVGTSHSLGVSVFFAFLLAALCLYGIVLSRRGGRHPKAANLSLGVVALAMAGLLLSFLQYVVIPTFSRPDVPASGRIQETASLCVVSENPWDGLIFRNALPKAHVLHAVPHAESSCVDGRPLLVYKNAAVPPARFRYKPVQSWDLEYTADDFLGRSPRKERARAVLYESTE